MQYVLPVMIVVSLNVISVTKSCKVTIDIDFYEEGKKFDEL